MGRSKWPRTTTRNGTQVGGRTDSLWTCKVEKNLKRQRGKRLGGGRVISGGPRRGSRTLPLFQPPGLCDLRANIACSVTHPPTSVRRRFQGRRDHLCLQACRTRTTPSNVSGFWQPSVSPSPGQSQGRKRAAAAQAVHADPPAPSRSTTARTNGRPQRTAWPASEVTGCAMAHQFCPSDSPKKDAPCLLDANDPPVHSGFFGQSAVQVSVSR